MDPIDAIDKAVRTSFEEMAFMDAEPIGETAISLDVGQLVHIEFGHPVLGSVTLHLNVPTKRRLTENVYGQDWKKLSGSGVDDCLMELANIIAGSFLVHVGAVEHRHAVSLPQILYDESDLPRSGAALIRHYLVDDEPVRVTLVYQDRRSQPENGCE
jgi:hypothetical protein